MAFVVGEVLTKFEAEVKQLFDAIDKIEKALERLESRKFAIDIDFDINIINAITAGMDQLKQGIDEINEKINYAIDQLQSAASSVSRQIQDVATGTLSRVERDAAATAQTIWTKIALGGGLIVFASLTDLGRRFFKFASQSAETVSTIAREGAGFLSEVGRTLISQVVILNKNTTAMSIGILATISNVTSFIVKVSALGATIFVFRTFFKESVVLVKRFIGFGLNALTPIERASRVLSTIDLSMHQIGLKTGSLVKTVVLGLGAWLGPWNALLLGVPAFNSLIENILAFGARGRLRILTFLGSSRAQMRLIIFDLKEILANILPVILQFSKEIKKAFAGKGILARLTGIVTGGSRIRKVARTLITQVKEFPQHFQKIVAGVQQIATAMKTPVVKKQQEQYQMLGKTGTEAFLQIIPLVNIAKKSADALAPSIKNIEGNIRSLSNAAIKAKTDALGIDSTFVKVLETGKKLPRVIIAMIKGFNTLADSVRKGKGVENYFKAWQAGLQLLRNRFGPAVDKFTKGLSEKLTKGIETGFKIDPAQFKIALKMIDRELKKFGAKGKNRGAQLVSLVAEGMKSNKDAQKAMAIIAKEIMAFLPQSLPLVGALTGIYKAGVLITSYIAKGILAPVNLVKKAISVVASIIMKPINLIKSAAEAIEFKQATELGTNLVRMSERINVPIETLSELDFAAKTVGASVQELEWLFRRTSKNIADAMKDPALKKTFKNLGIDIEQVAQSAEPTLTAVEKLSDVLAGVPGDSNKARKALELLGIVGGSNLVNLLKRGSGGIRELREEARRMGAVMSESFARTSKRVTEFIIKLDLIKKSILRDIVEEILPEVETAVEEIFKLIRENRVVIKAYIATIVFVVKSLALALFNLFKRVIADPKAAFEELKHLAMATLDFVKIALANIFSILAITGEEQITKIWFRLRILFTQNFEWIATQTEFILEVIWKIISVWLPKLLGFIGSVAGEISQLILGAIVGTLKGRDPEKEFRETFRNLTAIGSDEAKKLRNELQESYVQANQESAKYTDAEGRQIKFRAKFFRDLDRIRIQSAVNTATTEQELAKQTQSIVRKAFSGMKVHVGEYEDKIRETGVTAKKALIEPIENLRKAVKKFGEAVNQAKSPIALKFYEDWIKMVDQLGVKFDEAAQKTEEFYGALGGKPGELARPEDALAEREPLELDFSAVLDGMEKALKTFLEKGKVTMQELGDIAQEVFSASFSQVMGDLKKAITGVLTDVLAQIPGITKEIGQAAISGIIAAASLLISRMRDNANTAHEAIKSTIEKTEQLRGVIAGETQIGILEVANKLALINRPLVIELRGIREIVAEIRDILLGGGALEFQRGY